MNMAEEAGLFIIINPPYNDKAGVYFLKDNEGVMIRRDRSMERSFLLTKT